MLIKKNILSVDDETINQFIIKEMLENDYELDFADDGRGCIEMISKSSPDLILLDVNMPDLNGLEVCRQIRNNPDSSDIPVIFVSALASSKERIQGYEAGGDDYVTKPFVEQELIQKIKLLLAHQEDKEILKANSNETMDALMTSLNSSGELGIVINFLRESFACQSLDQLIRLTFEALGEFYLSGSIMVSAFNKPLYFFSDGKNRPLERDILFYLSNNQSILSFSGRAIFNNKNLTLLIRNMPNDEHKAGRYRDHLAMLVDGLEARISGIKNEQKMIERKNQLADIIQITQEKLQYIDEKHQSQRTKHAQLLSDMAQNIEESFLRLGLSEIQEEKLVELVSQTENKTDSLYEEGLQTDDEFNQIMYQLNISLAEK